MPEPQPQHGQGQGNSNTSPFGTTPQGTAPQPPQGAPAQPPGPAGNPSGGPGPASGPSIDSAVLEKCNTVIDQYRAGTVSKARAYVELQKSIPADDEDVFYAALEAQMRAIDSIDRLRDTAMPRGLATATGLGGGPAGGPHEDNGPQGAGDDLLGKRARSPDAEDDADVEHRSTRKRLDTQLFAWSVGNEIDKAILPATVVETNRQLENFSRDLKGAKTHLLNATSRPQFPDEEWGNILSGRVVDLDRVLSSIYSVSVNHKSVERVGALELTFGHATPSKTVKTYGDWVTAWSATSEAVLFILPHLKADLDAYAKHIQAYFRSLPSEGIYPQRVINYDRAVRIRVSERRDTRLTDFFAFSDLQLMWIHGPMVPDAPRTSGGNSGRSRRADGRPDARVRDPCNRWNAGSCPNSTSSCKYAHVCRKCRSNRHAEGSCTASD
ncbi:hypothetical protein BD626DRAFT_403342 [Schizophyllum amplum]|uniref:C3H1-type domain-containing protein n=1 Tax=Schizophyllum amplum TaxID=97359 RepID=A0A550CE12_9AGAR|nr:hypothetical protein BD626DRAFT_403342 [Auriculariopsis ampla]